MQMKKRLLSICFVFALLCAVCLPAYAAVDVPDPSKSGTIQVTMLYNNQPVSGGSLSVYRVGQIQENDGDYSFALTDKFAGSGVSLDQQAISEPDTAQTLSDFVDNNNMSPDQTGTIDNTGYVELDGLVLGLYLVKQNQAAPGYLCTDPFLVAVPYLDENGLYQYQIDASPKVSELKVAPPTQNDQQPSATPTPMVVETQTVTQSGITLPQTGQLNWPIPVLVVLGLGLFALGWFLRFGKRDQDAR